jgi:hypothetical protein
MPRNSLGDISRAPMISRLSSCNSGSWSSVKNGDFRLG